MMRSIKLSSVMLVHPVLGSAGKNELEPGQVASINHSKGKHLFCTSGKLWVTLEHDAGDYILEADEELDIDENGRVVISALDSSGTFKVA